MRMKLRYLRLFQKKQKWSLFLLFMLYFLSMFVFAIMTGSINYTVRHRNYYQNSGLKQMDYVSRSPMANNDRALVSETMKMSGVVTILESSLPSAEIIFSKDVIARFNGAKINLIAPDNLKYFASDTTPTVDKLQFSNDPSVVDIVVNRNSSLVVGETLPASVGGKALTLRVLAKRANSDLSWAFSSGGTSMGWRSAVQEDPTVFMLSNPDLDKPRSNRMISSAMFVVYDNDISPAQRKAVQDFLLDRGAVAVHTSDAMTQETAKDIKFDLKRKLPIPLGIAIFAYILCVCTAIMRIFKLEQHMAIYQLAGGSQRKMIWGLNSWFILIASGSILLVLGMIKIFDIVRPDFLYRTNRIIFDFNIYKYLILFVLLSIVSSFIITVALLKKTTLMEKLRRRQ